MWDTAVTLDHACSTAEGRGRHCWPSIMQITAVSTLLSPYYLSTASLQLTMSRGRHTGVAHNSVQLVLWPHYTAAHSLHCSLLSMSTHYDDTPGTSVPTREVYRVEDRSTNYLPPARPRLVYGYVVRLRSPGCKKCCSLMSEDQEDVLQRRSAVTSDQWHQGPALSGRTTAVAHSALRYSPRYLHTRISTLSTHRNSKNTLTICVTGGSMEAGQWWGRAQYI